MVQFRVEFASTSWPSQSHREAILSHRDYIVSCCRVAIDTIGQVLLHEGNTKETGCCPIVLGRQHDIVYVHVTPGIITVIIPGVTWTYKK